MGQRDPQAGWVWSLSSEVASDWAPIYCCMPAISLSQASDSSSPPGQQVGALHPSQDTDWPGVEQSFIGWSLTSACCHLSR